MICNIGIKEMAIHGVDKEKEEPELSENTIDISQLDKDTREYLEKHISGMWVCEESPRVRSAKFEDESLIRDGYTFLKSSRKDFLEISRQFAQRLFDISPASSSPGWLFVILFTSSDKDNGEKDEEPFLGLFKMNTVSERFATLDEKDFNIRVEYIPYILPRTNGDRVVKCAIIRHPTRDDKDLKLRDNQGNEPANYFLDFLGCRCVLSEERQIKRMINVLETYAGNCKAELRLENDIPAIFSDIEDGVLINNDSFINAVQQSGIFKEFNRDDFKKVVENKRCQFEIRNKCMNDGIITYYLPNGIVIEGRMNAMNTLIKKIPCHPNIRFEVTSPLNYHVAIKYE